MALRASALKTPRAERVVTFAGAGEGEPGPAPGGTKGGVRVKLDGDWSLCLSTLSNVAGAGQRTCPAMQYSRPADSCGCEQVCRCATRAPQ